MIAAAIRAAGGEGDKRGTQNAQLFTYRRVWKRTYPDGTI